MILSPMIFIVITHCMCLLKGWVAGLLFLSFDQSFVTLSQNHFYTLTLCMSFFSQTISLYYIHFFANFDMLFDKKNTKNSIPNIDTRVYLLSNIILRIRRQISSLIFEHSILLIWSNSSLYHNSILSIIGMAY